MKNKVNADIPTHSLESARAQIMVRSIDHKNHYDFTKVHRHSYFEVMFFLQGGGKNLIDFVEYEVQSNACYLIFPGQIHLLNRAPGSQGHVIQFQIDVIEAPKLQRVLQEKAWSGFGAVMFQEDAALMQHAMRWVSLLADLGNQSSAHGLEAQRHLLQGLLFDLLSHQDVGEPVAALDPDFHHFLQLIDSHFREAQTVGYYLDRLAIGEKRLANLAQKYRGLSPLQIIHQRILLEAKRLLSTGHLPHKEIAYDLGFDSPASFSAFIKKKTGLTASEIQAQVEEIHKQ